MNEWIFEQNINPRDFKGFVYLITNTTNGRMYIGAKLIFNCRDKETNWKTYHGSSKELSADVIAIGMEHFKREILYFCVDRDNIYDLEIKEQMVRNVLKEKFADGTYVYYNKHIAKKFRPPSEHSAETRRKISEGNKGKTMSDEAKRHLSEVNKGRSPSEKTIAKSHSDEANRKRSEKLKGRTITEKERRGLEAGWKFKKSPEGRAAHSERVKSPEDRERQRIAMTGKVKSPEAKARQSKAMKGKVRTPEANAKTSEAMKRYWKARRTAAKNSEPPEEP